MNTAYLLLGSNEGERVDWFRQAESLMAEFCAVIKKSAIYETAAWGQHDQPDFLNQVLEIETELSAELLLLRTQAIETLLGRRRLVKWGQRTLDIDILFFNSEIVDLPHLKVPHPALHRRSFTLVPLAEIAPDLVHPVLQQSVQVMLEKCDDALPVRKMAMD